MAQLADITDTAPDAAANIVGEEGVMRPFEIDTKRLSSKRSSRYADVEVRNDAFQPNLTPPPADSATGNADAGFVALSQVREQQVPSSQYRIIDEHMHQPIAQGVVLLKSGAQSKRALAFLNFLLDERATGIAMNKTPRKLGPAQTAGPKRSSVIDQ